MTRSLALLTVLTACGGMQGGADSGAPPDAGADGGSDAGVEAGDGGVLLVLTSEGLFRSIDDGANWRRTALNLAATGSSLGVNGQRFFLGEGFVGIRTSDDGHSWSAPNGPSATAQCFAAAGSVTFTGTFRGGLWRSPDLGSTWVQTDAGVPLDEDVTALEVNGSTVLVGTLVDGVFYSTDTGATFTQATGLPNPEPTGYGFARDGNTYYLAGSDVYVSATSGSTWVKATGAGLPPLDGVRAMLPLGSGRMLGGTFAHGLYVTSDGAASWTAVSDLPADAGVASLHRAHGLLWASTPSGLYRSLDGGSWTKQQIGIGSFNPAGPFTAR